jgi:hypothetical protein
VTFALNHADCPAVITFEGGLTDTEALAGTESPIETIKNKALTSVSSLYRAGMLFCPYEQSSTCEHFLPSLVHPSWSLAKHVRWGMFHLYGGKSLPRKSHAC